MFAVALGLLAATSYGFADFFGGLASKKANPIRVTGIALGIGLLFLLLVSIFLRPEFSNQTILFGVLAGICSGLALTMFYAALALGPISIVSPLTAVAGAVLPVIVDVALGQTLGAFTVLAIVVIIAAAGLVSVVPSKKVPLPSTKALLLSLGGGAGFAGIFVFLDLTPADSGIAPLVVMRIVGVFMLGVAIAVLTQRDRKLGRAKDKFSKTLILMISISAVLDVSANLFFLIGTREGVLAVVAVVTSLYPIGTVALARIVLKEKLANLQWTGIAMAILGCVLLAI